MAAEDALQQSASELLTHIAVKLAEMHLSQAQSKQIFDQVLASLVAVAGVPMNGRTYTPAARDDEARAHLANTLGTTSSNKNISLYRYVMPSIGSSGAVVYTDGNTGELMTLLVRKRKENDQWTYTAGYIELPAENENTQQARAALNAHFADLTAQKGSQVANRLMNDGNYVRSTLQARGITLPEGIDLTSRENYERETREESGLDLKAFPQAQTQLVRVGNTFSHSSAAQKNYTASPHYLTDLGTLNEPPPLASQDPEIVDAVWVKIKDLQPQPNGTYTVPATDKVGTLPLNIYIAPIIEDSLNALVSRRIQQVSGGQLTDITNLRATLSGWVGKMQRQKATPAEIQAIDRIEATALHNGQPELMGAEGIQNLQDYMTAAGMLSRIPAPKVAEMSTSLPGTAR